MPSSGPSVQRLVCSSHSVSTWLTMLYFISLYIQNLEPGVSYFGIVLFLRWIRGGTQGCPYQHPVSNEGAGISAVQWEALQFCGFTWETQAIRKMQWSHCWPSRTRGSILPNSYWIKELDIAIPSCAQPTPPWASGLFSENPEPHLRFFLGPCTVSKHILLIAQPQVPQHLCGAEGAGPSTTHTLSPSESRDVLRLWSRLVRNLSYVCGQDSASRKSFSLNCLMSRCGCKYSHAISIRQKFIVLLSIKWVWSEY